MNDEKTILTEINSQFGLEKVELRTYSPLALAFIGDSLYDVVVKTVIVERGNCQVNKLQNRTAQIVKAVTQAKLYDYLKDGHISEEEEAILRRGRNAKPYTKAKNASYGEYCKATGIETLIGYLYLKGDTERLVEIVKTGIELAENE